MVGPAQRIQDGRGAVRHTGAGHDPGDLQKVFLGRAAQRTHRFRGVALDMLAQQVEHAAREHAARVGQRLVAQRVTVRADFVGPRRFVVHLLVGIETAEQAVFEIEVLAHDQGRVGIRPDVLVVDLVVAEQVIDQAHQERGIRAGADRRVHVRHRRDAAEARIDHHHRGLVAHLGLDRPLEADRMGLGGVAAHHQDHVGVLNIHPMVGHRATAERRRQRRHGGAVAQARLAIHADHAQRTRELEVEDAGFVARRRRGQHARAQPAVDQLALLVAFDEVGVAVVLEQAGDARIGLVPGDALPFVGAGLAHFGVSQALFAVDVVDQPRPLGTERTTADRMIRVALDVEDLRLDVLGAVAQAVHQDATAHRTVGTPTEQ